MKSKFLVRATSATAFAAAFVFVVGWIDVDDDADLGDCYDQLARYYSSSGGSYESSGGSYESSGGSYGSSGGGSIQDKIENKYDADYDAAAAYYKGRSAPAHQDIDSAKTLSWAAGATSRTYTPDTLWFKWTAPETGLASFSTRGSISTPAWNCDTYLGVYTVEPLDNLADSGAYGWVRDAASGETVRAFYTAENADGDWEELYDAEGRPVDATTFKDVAVSYLADNDDEEEEAYEWGSLVSFQAKKGETYYILAEAYTPGEIRLAWHMKGHEADVATPVFRFYSSKYKGHFYTSSAAEKNSIIANDPNWKYEGGSYESNYDGGGALTPLYRFYSSSYKAHFFTINRNERDAVILGDPNWKYEGIAYYVHARQDSGTVPVHRFWSAAYRHHFYTTSESEKNFLIQTNPNWKYEGIAFYATP